MPILESTYSRKAESINRKDLQRLRSCIRVTQTSSLVPYQCTYTHINVYKVYATGCPIDIAHAAIHSHNSMYPFRFEFVVNLRTF